GNVVCGDASLSASLSSSMAELTPPNSALARATSQSERVTSCGSTSGESRISMPLFRRGVSKSRTVLVLELGVAAAVVEQRRAVLNAGRFHLTDDNCVISTVVQRDAPTLDEAQDVVENSVPTRRPGEADSLEPFDVDDRKAAGNLLLPGGENVDDESGSGSQRFVDRRTVLDANEHEWRVEAERAERAYSHPLIGPVRASRRYHGHT